MLELTPKRTAVNHQARAAYENPQPRKLLLALLLVLIALLAVVLKDQQIWFGSDHSTLESDGPEPSVASRTSAPAAKTPASQVKTQVPASKKRIASAASETQPKPADAPVITANRTVLPPLDVEVIAGNAPHKVHAGSNSSKLEITQSQSTANIAAATNAAEHERIAAGASQPQPASYPLLAQHMNVQGSVVLQAIIGADGVVQNLHVVSGPGILSSAAQQAVREWRFKPVVQNGQAVETKAKITVNFTIKVAGNSETTIADSRPVPIESLMR
jgi:TonB family protein